MRVVREIAEARGALAQLRRASAQVGLVPTMGAFHEGHLSLMRRARSECEVVVVSLFVNPTQFNDPTDLAGYPRDETRDLALAEGLGVDLVFAPGAQEMYPAGFATTVGVAVDEDRLEASGRGRRHFEGVATVVTKLFNIVAPDVAYFGQKDAQQAHLIKRLVRDLDLPIEIRVCPIVREPDGLAMSSRNVLLDPDERARAGSLHRALQNASATVAGGERDPGPVIAAALAELEAGGVATEYFELVSADTFAPVQHINGDVLALVAARVGPTRLIDNLELI